MYLQRIQLNHVRLFETDEISFVGDGGATRMFSVVIAENGLAKTTLLQAIALAAAGVGGGNKLASNAASFFDKRWTPTEEETQRLEDVCQIDAAFAFSDALHHLREYPGVEGPQDPPLLHAWLYAPHGWKQFDGHSEFAVAPPTREPEDAGGRERRKKLPLDEARAKDLPRWFVAGYGTSRALPLPQSPSESGNRSIDRLVSLFRPEPLIATGFVDVLSQQYGPDVAREYVKVLRDVLVGSDTLPGLLPREGTVQIENIELRGSGGVRSHGDLTEAERVILRFGDGERVKLPAVWLSSGYQSTMAWVADLIGQVALEAGEVISPVKMEGIVLIDEIDRALHPRWQATLVPALKLTFPRMQFIATTHSPMILPGLTPGEVIVLRANERGSVTHERPEEDPRLLTAAQLFREFFGIRGLFPSPLGDRLRRYGMLSGVVERSDDEEAEVHRLYDELRKEGVEVWAPEPRHAPVTTPEATTT